jgi:single-stranded-DNA-specific exonuclease
VPNRFDFGYGLTPELIAVAAPLSPDLIITVDNGISSLEGVEAARRLGIRVLITDHHLPGAILPAADAIVNPNLTADPFPSKSLAGVGVIFYVILALRARLREDGWFAQVGLPEPNLAHLLDLVALGTVADVVPLDRNNRILVAQGLARMRAQQCCAGVAALARVAGRSLARLSAQDLGFALAPRLNAAGRLEDMSHGIACLLSDNEDEALALAVRLDELNRERRSIEDHMHEQALQHLTSRLQHQDTLPFGLCLFEAQWHQGVIGILAARVRERFHRPVIAFALANETEIKGSARSVPNLHIRDALAAIAAREPQLIAKFGGHAMAAGLSLKKEHFEAFSAAFDAEVRHHLRQEDLQGVIYSDGELLPRELTLEVAEVLQAAGPWGQGFPEPVFDGLFNVADARTVAERHLRLTLQCTGGSRVIPAIAFNTPIEPWLQNGRPVHIAYRLDMNEYQGLKSPQLVVEHIEPR